MTKSSSSSDLRFGLEDLDGSGKCMICGRLVKDHTDKEVLICNDTINDAANEAESMHE